MEHEEHVYFVELAGADARISLEAQAAQWRTEGVRTTLLRSDDQPELWLLIGTASSPPPAATVDGARTWGFRRPTLDEA